MWKFFNFFAMAADGRSCQPTAGLREQHAGWHSSLPHAQTAVSSECCGTAHLPSQALRIRHRCTPQSILAACSVPERIQFKIAVLTYRVLHSDASWYLGPFTSTADVPDRRAIRSAGANRPVVPPVRLTTVGSRALPVGMFPFHTLLDHMCVISSAYVYVDQ